ncbi:hypothetical protein A2863_04260 [Candidatus Woesebacteria bacterium RIFCSPHIGHO2_01_FULL_38_9b]|uniref:TrpR like protein, YerC/YecD n=1 Tax=Candidatus Woesebacteria bacterium RIFCSPHIGHO2_01_FULL_38_9b TaxID=1802493 RepID=A0A1F7Y3S5_9BACT|nr:MAG: hypothetical protein A2863_04260 [Candidatus Woesebacteria bacterium RIFCSPHIGHO2_01_FULL_38_9b]
MTQISRYPISKDVYNRVFDIFLKTITGLYVKKITANFLKEFLTPTEQVMLAKRLSVAFLLAKGYQHREISRILRVSTGTVNRVAYSYKKGQYFNVVIEKILRDEKIDEFWQEIGETVTKLFSAGGSKSGAWRYLKEEINTKKRSKVF